ncbi:MAG TPA: metallophosphoesterase [Terriglobales bacterium]|nr:metallophosphoesterase [Terriglobales bacterium]
MIHYHSEFEATHDLERRLAPRRAIEAAMRSGRWTHAHKDSLVLRDHIARPILRTALKIAGIYSRGTRNALQPVVRHLRLEFHDLPESFDGFRILHLTDLHIDGVDGLAEIVAERIAGLHADLCVMTGDYRYEIAGPCDAVYPRLRTILSSVQAHHGVAAVLGNHDESEMAGELEKLGVRMLVNEAVEIRRGGARLWVIGVDDPHCYGLDDLDGALEGVPADAFKVLLAHSPEIFEEAAAAGVHLCLCGHTHAGQIRLPVIGGILTNADCPRSYTQGVWHHGSVLGYTSAGVGCSLLPVRYNCPPEIAMIELTRK